MLQALQLADAAHMQKYPTPRTDSSSSAGAILTPGLGTPSRRLSAAQQSRFCRATVSSVYWAWARQADNMV